MKQKTTGETIAFPALNSHVETLAKYAAMTGADRDLILTAIILEEIEQLNSERPYDASFALREFTLPGGKAETTIHPRVLKDVKEYAQGFGIEVSRVLTWCAMRGLHDLKSNLRRFEIELNEYGKSRIKDRISSLAELAVKLGVSLNNPFPSYSIKRESNQTYILADNSALLGFEIQFLHEEGFTPPKERMAVLSFEADDHEEKAC